MAARDDMSAEDRLIARFFEPLATHPGALGLADDAAFLSPPPGCDLVLKTDAIVGGVHFFPDDAAHTVASKALRVNLSDLAAKGARPLGFLLSLALPKECGEQWLQDLPKDYVAMQYYLPVHCSAATPFARQVRSRFPSQCWEAFLKERWCVAPAPNPATAYS